MKMKKTILLFIIFNFFSTVFSQNRLNESDFNVDSFNEKCRHADYINNNFNYWQSEYSNKCLYRRKSWWPKTWNNSGTWEWDGVDCPCPGGGNHSPDLSISNYVQGLCIGMGNYELIQQKLTRDNRLEEGKFYKLSFKLKVPRIYDGDVVNGSTNTFLEFMLAKGKVKYVKKGPEYFGNATWTMCDADDPIGYLEYSDWYKEYEPNHFITILKERIIGHPFDEWIPIQIGFKMPEEGLDKHNWFVIDFRTDNKTIENSYVFIDDVTLEEVERCNVNEPCSPTDGYIQRNAIHVISNENSNYIIDGLENVSLAKNMRIVDVNNSEVVRLPDKYCPNGIDYVHWNGRSSGGHILASGWYGWKMDLENDCDTKHYNVVFILPHMGGRPALPDNFECNQSVTQVLPCCEAEPNIFIENETLQGAGNISYHAINNITISNTIIKSSATNVTFKAGNEIILNTGFETEQGANVEMIIEPCENKQPEKRDSLYEKEVFKDIFVDDIEFSKEELIEQNIIEHNKLLFQIQPNPANDFINVYIDFLDKKCCSCNNYNIISIKDISGKGYYSEKILGNEVRINLSNFLKQRFFRN